MKPIPEHLRDRPFTYAEAKQAGLNGHNLAGSRFRRLHPRVYCRADLELTWDKEVEAARLAMPSDAQLTGLTRIQLAGVDHGPRHPIRFVVARDHHIALVGIFLHRTEKMPPLDGAGVVIEAAFIAYCDYARMIDAIKLGDHLLHHELMSLARLIELATAEIWRDGAYEALWIVEHLDGRSRSGPESELRIFVIAAGLPRPDVNKELMLSSGRRVIGDLVYVLLRLFVEYEGDHHQVDRAQYLADIDRYADLRADSHEYLQITKEKQRRPQQVVRSIHHKMVERGYDGPPPVFGEAWRQVFLPIAVALGESWKDKPRAS